MDNDELWEEIDRVENIIGTKVFLLSLEKALPIDQLENLTSYICRMFDIETKCKEKHE